MQDWQKCEPFLGQFLFRAGVPESQMQVLFFVQVNWVDVGGFDVDVKVELSKKYPSLQAVQFDNLKFCSVNDPDNSSSGPK